MSTINTNYASLLSSLYSANTSGTSTLESLLSASTSSSDSTSTQSTDTVSLSEQAREAYQSLQLSLINVSFDSDSSGESSGLLSSDSIESILVNSMNARLKPYLEMIAAKIDASTTSSADDSTGSDGSASVKSSTDS